MRINIKAGVGMRPFFLTSLFILTTFISLNSFIKKTIKADDEGKKLFTTYCSSCHMLPDPGSLTKNIWKNHVLPIMASRMGIIYPKD